MDLHVIGCDGSYPSANGATSGYLLKGEPDAGCYLLDCGSGVLSRLMALMDPAELEGIVITHWHNDHACDLLVLRYYLQIAGKQMHVYAPAHEHPLRQLCVCNEFILHDVADGFELGAFKMTARRVPHSVPSYAVRFHNGGRSLVYTGDIAAWEDTVDFCADADLLVCDASFTQAQWHEGMPHLSAYQAGLLGAKAQAKQLLLTHCPPVNDWRTLLKEGQQTYERAQFAQAGLRVAL